MGRDSYEQNRFGAEYLTRGRLGQGAFRVLVTDAYERRCAVTGEKTLPVLEAAHIKPYALQGPHRVSNGILLRSDLHKLFDLGYITVTPELKLEVSPRLKTEWQNGREYYAHHGQPLTGPTSRPGESTQSGISLLAQRKQVPPMTTDHPIEPPVSLEALRDVLRQFASERDWDQFHSPKNLAIALSVETAELLERFQWMSEAKSATLTPDEKAKIREEVADVLLYLIRLADKLNIDLLAAATDKIQLNAKKYPVALAKGSAKKYTEL